jgi:hypothetical protein
MKMIRSCCLGFLLMLPLLAAAGCEVDVGRYADYDRHVYYRDGYRYLYPEHVYVPHDGAHVIIRPDGRRDYVYDR